MNTDNVRQLFKPRNPLDMVRELFACFLESTGGDDVKALALTKQYIEAIEATRSQREATEAAETQLRSTAREIVEAGRRVYEQKIAPPASPPPRRAAEPRARGRGHAPRRAQRAAAPAARVEASSNDPPGPPPPSLLISDASAFAAVGLTPRAFRKLVRKHSLPHARAGRRTLVRADVLLAALGLAATPPTPEPTAPKWSADALVAWLTKGGRR